MPGRRKAVKALYKACKRFYDISTHGTAKCGLNAIKSASEDFLKPAVTGYSFRCFARLRAIILPRVSDGRFRSIRMLMAVYPDNNANITCIKFSLQTLKIA